MTKKFGAPAARGGATGDDGGVTGVLTLVLALLAIACAAALRAERRATAADREAAEARLLARLGMALATGDDAESDVAALAAFAADELGAAAVVVGTGTPPVVLHAGGLAADEALGALRTPPPGAVRCTAPMAGADVVTVCALPGDAPLDPRRRPLFEAFAGRVAATVDRARLRAERRDREVLEATERQRAALISAVSHDLRSPLAAIKASASALGSPEVSDADREAMRNAIGIEADRLDRMVRNLLDLGRIESGRLVAHPEPVPVDELVGSVLARLRPYLRERRLELDVPSHLPAMMVDPVQGEQALGNLVENVIAHTPLNAGLIVRAATRKQWVTVRVADEGPGIADHDKARIFQRFERGTSAGPGSGLGLAIARAYAEANGGGLDVAQPAGCGAAFELWFPAAS